MKDNFTELIRAGAPELPTPAASANLERRVMIEVARRALARSRARARRGMVASLAGLAMLLAGCLTALVVWFPAGTTDAAGIAPLSTAAVEALGTAYGTAGIAPLPTPAAEAGASGSAGAAGGFLPTGAVGAAGELMQRFDSWLEKALALLPDAARAAHAALTTSDATGTGALAATGEIAAGAPLVEQWAGPILLILLVAAVGGGIWYLNSLFSADEERC